MTKRCPLGAKDNIPEKRCSLAKNRFKFDDDDDFEQYKKGFIVKNTADDTQKCLKLFNEWKNERNAMFPNDPVPQDILQGGNKVELCKWLSKFAIEVRKKDGSPYPPRTIHHYLSGIQRHIRTEEKLEINLMNDKEFIELRNVLDTLFRKLHSEGVGTSSKKTPVLGDDDEEQLWTSGVLDPETPQGLLNCVFFLNGKNFCLRGGVEHHQLKLSQFKREVVKIEGHHKVRYTYTEYVSKNRVGGLKQLKQQNKIVHQYESDDLHRCHVLLLDKYISKLPEEAKRKDLFYVRPKPAKPKDHTTPWFTAVSIGRHTLSAMMKRMSTDAQLDKEFTNHSLRAYGVTKLFKANLPEKLIMERSGHRSLEGLRQYERTGMAQELQVCKVLANKPSESKTLRPIPPQSSNLPPRPVLDQFPSFSGCSFTNCTFQLAAPVPNTPISPTLPDDFSDVDLNELLDF